MEKSSVLEFRGDVDDSAWDEGVEGSGGFCFDCALGVESYVEVYWGENVSGGLLAICFLFLRSMGYGFLFVVPLVSTVVLFVFLLRLGEMVHP